MTAQDKIFELFYILLQRKKVTAACLAEHFGVTQRTIYRWCDSLALAGIPIVCTQGKNGGIGLVEGYKIDSALLTDQEKLAISASLGAMSSLIEGETESYKSAAEKVKALAINASDWVKIDFAPWNENLAYRREIFDLIKDAIFSCRQLDFEYFAPMQNCQTRSVQPWKIIFRGQAWYLLAFCNQKQSPRYFKLSRIQKPKISQKPITQFFSAEMLRQNDESPVNRPLKTIRVKAQIENYALSNLLDDVPNAEILEQRENFSIVQFDFVDEDWTKYYFLKFGALLSVIEPAVLKQQIAEEIARMHKNYEIL